MPAGAGEAQVGYSALPIHEHFENHSSLKAPLAGEHGIFGDGVLAIKGGRFVHRNRGQLRVTPAERTMSRQRGILRNS
jgi:hypothetical protein